MDEAKKTEIRDAYKSNSKRIHDIMSGEWVCNCGGNCQSLFMLSISVPLEKVGVASMRFAFGEIKEEEFYATVHLANLMLASTIEMGEEKVANHTQARANA